MGSIWTHRNSPLYRRLSQRKNKQRINQDSLLVTGAVQEGHDLAARAGLVGAEQSAADTAGDAVLLRPRDSRGVVSVSRHIGEGSVAAHGRAAGGAIQEGDSLSARAGGIGAELAVAGAAGDAVFNGPGDCLGVVSVSGNIGEVARALGSGRTGRTPQEGDDLRTGAGLVGSEL